MSLIINGDMMNESIDKYVKDNMDSLIDQYIWHEIMKDWSVEGLIRDIKIDDILNDNPNPNILGWQASK